MANNSKRQRLNPEERRRLILQSAQDSLARYGAQGTGVREICKDIGVSPGLLTHYFDGKDSLFLESYQTMSRDYIAEIRQLAENREDSAEQRLKKLFSLYFSEEWSNSSIIGAYTGFWSLSRTNPALKAAFEETFKAQQAAFEILIEDLVEERGAKQIDPRPFAAFLLIFLEGTWLEMCLNPDVVEKESIQEICWDWLEIYLTRKSR